MRKMSETSTWSIGLVLVRPKWSTGSFSVLSTSSFLTLDSLAGP